MIFLTARSVIPISAAMAEAVIPGDSDSKLSTRDSDLLGTLSGTLLGTFSVVLCFMGGKTKSAKRCVMVNGVIFSGLQGVLRAIFGTLKT